MSSYSDRDNFFKLLMIGDSGVGKTSLLRRISGEMISSNHIGTIGADFKYRTISLYGECLQLQIWDTAGQERFRSITSSYFRGVHGVIVVYDVCREESFRNVKRWLRDIELNCDEISHVLVGNKNDSEPNSKAVLTEDARSFAALNGIQLFETSAKENTNVEEIVNYIAEQVFLAKKKKTGNEPITICEEIIATKKSKCC